MKKLIEEVKGEIDSEIKDYMKSEMNIEAVLKGKN